MRGVMSLTNSFYVFLVVFVAVNAIEPLKEEVDKVIEDEITKKLSEDLMQSIEKKFQVDLEKSVDLVLVKIKMLLHNGTVHIQDRLSQLQQQLDMLKKDDEKEVENCLIQRQNQTAALAEKALHQMVVCGYALIGHDPAQAVKQVMVMKNHIKQGVLPMRQHQKDINELLKICGHDHESLKKVIKCVISKSPIIKTVMMDVTGNLIDGVVQLTKLMAHGAMHEACLIEVIKTIEDEAFTLVDEVRNCVYSNNTDVLNDINQYMNHNNGTVLNIEEHSNKPDVEENKDVNNTDVTEMKALVRRMLKDNKAGNFDQQFKDKLEKLQKDLGVDQNVISNDIFLNKD